MAKTQKYSAAFTTVSLNRKSARLGVRLKTPDLLAVNDIIRNSQLKVTLTADPNAGKDIEGQATMDVGVLELSGIANVREFGVKRNADVGFSLLFSKSTVELDDLSQFVGTKGELQVKRLGKASAKVADDEG